MKFQAFHVNPGEKLKKKDVNNDLSNFMSVFPIKYGKKIFREFSAKLRTISHPDSPSINNNGFRKVQLELLGKPFWQYCPHSNNHQMGHNTFVLQQY